MTAPSLTPARARDLVHRLDGQPILVLGDVMLDRFIVGTVSRISPEAPVPVIRFRSEHCRPGGAANVACNLAALGGRVTLIGVTGADIAGDLLRDRLQAEGLSTDALIRETQRPTTEKVRVVTERNQQVARIDYEDDADVPEKVEMHLLEHIQAHARGCSAVLVSDYLKGTVTRGVMSALVELKAQGVPVLVDPKIPHLDYYTGATVVTPNTHEAEAATHRRIASDADARAAASTLRQRLNCDAVLITRGEHGMWLSSAAEEGGIPAAAREVADVTGAGDTVVAALGLALAAGATLGEAAILANHAAGVVVGKFGPAATSREELLVQLGIEN